MENKPILKMTQAGVFEFHCPTADLIAEIKHAGFKKDKYTKLYSTRMPSLAFNFIQYAENRTELALRAFKKTNVNSRSLSTNYTTKKLKNGLSYLPYQVAGIKFMKEKKRCLNGDEPGTGKTIQIAGLINEISEIRNVLVLCPASLRLNWLQELEKWLIRPLDILDVVSYDSSWRGKNSEARRGLHYDLIVMDEAHYLKNATSKRSMAAQRLTSRDDCRVVLLTGTPVMNRPKDLFTLLKIINEKMFPDFTAFAVRYCGAFLQELNLRNGKKKVWNTEGSSNEEELQDILRSTIMIRRLKNDVLPQLPKKIRQIIEIENDENAVKDEKVKWKNMCESLGYEEALKKLNEGNPVLFNEIAGERQNVALSKVPYVIEHIENLLLSESKIVLFAHHRAVVEQLVSGLLKHKPVKVVGGMTEKAKNESVISFQNDPECRIFVGNIQAAGVGLTLTASSIVVFAELDMVPSTMTQAEDRCCRIGASADSILVQHIVLNGSLDVKLARMLVKKQEVADLILDI